MDFSGIYAPNGWLAGCFECTARAVVSQLQGQQDWSILSDIGGPWQPGPCDSPVDAGIGSLQQSILTPATLSNYNTPSLSPSLSPEDTLANPLSSLGLDHNFLTEFGPEVVSWPQKEESPTSHDHKTECHSTVRRMRRREQNRESQRRFRDRKESYTKQLEKKISELEGISASLRLELTRLSELTAPEIDGGGRNVLSPCPNCGSENLGNLQKSAKAQEVTVAS